MKIILANLHFWPDTPPHANILKTIAEALAVENDVSVIASQPCYKKEYKIALKPKTVQMKEGYKVNRINLGLENTGYIYNKLKVFFGYTVFLFYKILKERPDRTIMGTNPPILGIFAVRIASKFLGSDYIYHCQDIHPEIASMTGSLSKGLIYKLLLHIEKKNCEQAFLIIVLSEDMKNSLMARGCNGKNIRIINNFNLREADKNLDHNITIPESIVRKKEKFRLIFAGNIGRFQGLETIIEVAELLSSSHPEIEFLFLGDGVLTDKLKKASKEMLNKTIYFFGHQTINTAVALIADSQLGIVSLDKDIYKYAFPSKTMTYLYEGVPLLCILEEESTLAKLVKRNKIGITAPHSSPKKIAEKITDLYYNSKMVSQMSINAKKYALEYYNVEILLPQLLKTFSEKSNSGTNK